MSESVGGAAATNRTDGDRVVSRRVDNPTAASEQDERVYRAAADDADPSPPDTGSGGEGGTVERASQELATDPGTDRAE